MSKIQTIINLLLYLIISSPSTFAQPQNGCDGTRYVYNVFQEIDKTTVQYAQNTDALGNAQQLYMDIYTPKDDTVSERPLIIWAFGGAFVAGDRAAMAERCQRFARKGYIAASIDYRLWDVLSMGVPDSLDLLDTAIKAMGDMKAAIRFFRQDAATDNEYRIATDFILVGGHSAGAITALHTAYLDADDEIPAYVQTAIDNNGGIEGNSGDAENLSYSSKVQGVINLSGALHKKEWLDADEPALLSYHGTADQVVPFNHGFASLFGFQFLSMDGSGLLHQEAETVGLGNYLLPVASGHRGPYEDMVFDSLRESFYTNSFLWLYQDLCEGITVDTKTAFKEAPNLKIFPNPSASQLTVSWSARTPVSYLYVCDQSGRVVHTRYQPKGESFSLDREILGKGIFSVHLRYEDVRLKPQVCQFLFQ